jgi:phosphatidylglycerol:prolipoprotein diacylglycerol transferase
MYLLAFIAFSWIGKIKIKQPHIAAIGWKKENIDDMLFYGMIGVVVGGRLGYVLFYNPSYYLSHLSEIFAIWKGGMSFHGGFLGVTAAMSFWSSKNSHKLMDVMDLIAPIVPIGYAFGRLGNFINGELPGRVILDTSIPWAMVWPNLDNLPRHPSPIYQMLIDGVLLFLILWLFSRKARPRMAVSGMFSLLYGSARFLTEYFRVPDYNVELARITISAGQMLSIPLIALGIVLLITAYKGSSSTSYSPEKY